MVQVLRGVSVVAGLMLAVATPFAIIHFRDSQEADYQAMRRFAISKLSVEQLNADHASAETEYAADRAKAIANHRKEADAKAAAQVRCDEVGFREKNPMVCWRGLSWGMPFEPIIATVEQRYDGKILGACFFVIRDARKYGCLPPD